jgi:hypothetical protein
VIEDIDKLDGDNELAVVDYIEDIYKFYKVAEVTESLSLLDPSSMPTQICAWSLKGAIFPGLAAERVPPV